MVAMASGIRSGPTTSPNDGGPKVGSVGKQKAACADIADVANDALVISIAAGVTLDTLQGALPGRRVVRVMPNTPCLVGMTAAAFTILWMKVQVEWKSIIYCNRKRNYQ